MAEIEKKTVNPMTVLSLAFTGSYRQTSDKLDELIGWVLRAGHPYAGPPMGIYFDDPKTVAESDLRAEALVPIEEECEIGEGIVRKQIPGAMVASAVHTGPYDKAHELYQEIFAWIAANGYRYVAEAGTREIFHTMMGEVDTPDSLVTEIQVPIEPAPAAETAESAPVAEEPEPAPPADSPEPPAAPEAEPAEEAEPESGPETP
jgi:effector-binding domain-containing protein